MSNVHPDVNTQMIERIVREVLQRLNNRSSLVVTSPSKTENDAGSLSLEQKVISVESIRGKLEDVSSLRLKPKTIVTPAARDELRDRGVEINFDLTSTTVVGVQQVILATTMEANERHTAQLRERMLQAGMSIELRQDSRVSRLVSKLTSQFSTTRRAIVLTDEPYTATCVANRNPSVRAAVVRDEAELQMVKKEINPNVIVVPANREVILEIVARELVS